MERKSIKEYNNQRSFTEMVKEYNDNFNPLSELFSRKLTENGDSAYKTTGNRLVDVFFFSEYFQKHLNEVKIDDSFISKVLAMFIRDPRKGLGRRDLGRVLMSQANVSKEDIVEAGRWDDLFKIETESYKDIQEFLNFIWDEVKKGNELAKKWMPRFNTKDDKLAKDICRYFNVSQKEYRKLIKADTVEKKLSLHEDETINYEQVPSLAMIKYYNRFLLKDPNFKTYLEKVKSGEKKLNFSTGTVYDIYKNRDKIDADLFFDKLPQVKISCIPIVDTSGSMQDANDSLGKAVSIGYYLARNSTYCPNYVISFSSRPQLLNLDGNKVTNSRYWSPLFSKGTGKFCRGIENMYTGDYSNTDFAAVINLLSGLKEFPEYFIVLSDQEFDRGSQQSVEQVFRMFDRNGIKTKIVWWNLNARQQTITTQINEPRCICMSGYSPQLLEFISNEFDAEKMLANLLEKYYKNILKK